MISFHPSFWNKYNTAQVFLNKIKDELRNDDTISLFSYSGSKLKKGLNKRKIK